MFTVTPALRAKMQERLTSLPVNARLMLIASGINYDECLLDAGVISTLRLTERSGFTFTVNSALRPGENNQACAHGLAHLMLHSQKFDFSHTHVDLVGNAVNPFPERDPLDATDNEAANRLALEILIPTIPLREAFLYFEGKTSAIAERFKVPTPLVHTALVRAKLMDARSCAS